jgi:hypothetical protein
MKAIKNFTNVKNFRKKLPNFTKNSFSSKHIPISNLKFEDKKFYEPLCKIYDLENKEEINAIKSASILMYLNLILVGIQMTLHLLTYIDFPLSGQ